MIRAQIANDEFERLSTLLDYKILDSQPEIEYDDITQLALIICKTTMASVTLIDENRQWFKSRVGIDLTESPRDTSFCGHAIHQRDVFIVKDSLKDVRFFDNPAVKNDPKIRFYAGAPLVAPNGHAVGTLCVFDHKIGDLTSEQIKALQILSRQVVSQLELRKAYRTMNENYENLRLLSKKVHKQEQMLIQTTKMAALGEMAADAAHEINNPLTIINGRATQILKEAEKRPLDVQKVEKYAQGIIENVTRITRVVRTLKGFSISTEPLEKVRIHVSHIVENMVSLYEERARDADTKFEIEILNDSVILCSQVHISQILLNLLNNAFDAIRKVDQKWIRIVISREENNAHIKVIDSGSGIAEQNRSKVMEPFFTTKITGTGVGLGLSVSKELAVAEGGSLELDLSSRSTCFLLRLPVEIPK